MRKLLFFAVVLLAVPVAAQETYSCIAPNAQAVQIVDNRRADENTETCARYGFPSTCTQAQVCATTGTNGCNAAGGASCTATQARAAGCEIYPQSLAGRDTYTRAEFVRQLKDEAPRRDQQISGQAYCTWWRTVATQAQKDADCAKASPTRPPGCQICPP